MQPPEFPPEEQSTPAAPPPPEFPFWGVADVVLFLGLGLPIAFVVMMLVHAPLAMLGIESKALRLLLPQFAGYISTLPLLWLIFRSRYGRSPLEALRLGVGRWPALWSVPAGIAAAFGVLVGGVVLRTPAMDTPMEALLRDPVSIAVVGALASTIGPFFEELFFRGLLQPVMVTRTGIVLGIFIAALPFALLHGPQYAWSWRHLLLITLAGAAFGWRRHETGSTGAAAIMHAAYNFTLFIGFLVGRAVEAGVGPESV